MAAIFLLTAVIFFFKGVYEAWLGAPQDYSAYQRR